MNSVIILINTAMSFTTMWIVYKYLNIFFEKRKKKSIFGTAGWITFFILQFWLENNKGRGTIEIFLINTILIFFICVTEYFGMIYKKILFVGLLYVVWILLEMFFSFLLKDLAIGNIEYGILGSTISKIIMLVLISLLNVKLWKSKNIFISYTVMLFVIPASSIFIAYDIFLLGYNNRGGKILSIFSFVLLLIINIIIFEVYEKFCVSIEIQRENAIFDQQIKLLSKHTEEQKKSMEEYWEIQHDLLQQYIGLKSNIEQNQKVKPLEILETLLKDGNTKLEGIADSGNDIIDSLLNYKYSIANKNDIDFRVKAFIPDELPIKQKDLCVILGNALDNAIEATQKCTSGKFIDISVGVKKEAFVVVIKNSYVGKLIFDEHENLTTSKENRKSHGYGICSMRKVVERNHGEMVMKAKDGIFSLTIIMNYK